MAEVKRVSHLLGPADAITTDARRYHQQCQCQRNRDQYSHQNDSPTGHTIGRRVNNTDQGLLTGPYQLSDPVRDYIDFGPGRPI